MPTFSDARIRQPPLWLSSLFLWIRGTRACQEIKFNEWRLKVIYEWHRIPFGLSVQSTLMRRICSSSKQQTIANFPQHVAVLSYSLASFWRWCSRWNPLFDCLVHLLLECLDLLLEVLDLYTVRDSALLEVLDLYTVRDSALGVGGRRGFCLATMVNWWRGRWNERLMGKDMHLHHFLSSFLLL